LYSSLYLDSWEHFNQFDLKIIVLTLKIAADGIQGFFSFLKMDENDEKQVIDMF
jgi:hypothetical protein